MKIIDVGHLYKIDALDDGPKQTLQFVKREGDGFPFNDGSYGGTNCQEVIRALIDRSEYLNKQLPSAETEAIIGCLKTALFLFEARAARRHNRHLEWNDLYEGVRKKPCKECGHIDCGHNENE